ncbi:hypothetical protein TWF506_004036 [Arthrobotrys conoides]|uniref:Uncharacterized protein n=1 Tax=Arthrobotrys conoides TaxID=74498 RepID=A0AAN8NC93_9PEZI
MSKATAPANWQPQPGQYDTVLATSENVVDWYHTLRRSNEISEETQDDKQARLAEEKEILDLIRDVELGKIGARVPVKRGGQITPPRFSTVKLPPENPKIQKYLEEERKNIKIIPPPNIKVTRDEATSLPRVGVRIKLVGNKEVAQDSSALPDTGAVDMWLPLEYFPSVENEKYHIDGFPYPAYQRPVSFELVGVGEVFEVNAIFTRRENFPGGYSQPVLGHRKLWNSMKFLWIGYQPDGTTDQLVVIKYKRVDGEVVDLYTEES